VGKVLRALERVCFVTSVLEEDAPPQLGLWLHICTAILSVC